MFSFPVKKKSSLVFSASKLSRDVLPPPRCRGVYSKKERKYKKQKHKAHMQEKQNQIVVVISEEEVLV
jgi:hypothetical protein